MTETNQQQHERRAFDFSQYPERIDVDEGLALDSFTLEDATSLADITDSDVELQKYIPWAKEDKEKYIERVNRDRKLWGPRYAVRLDGQLVGHIAIFPSLDHEGVIELGYLLAKNARGKSVIDRVVPECEALVADNFPSAKLALCINDKNLASQKVAERLGYQASDILSKGDRMYFKVVKNE